MTSQGLPRVKSFMYLVLPLAVCRICSIASASVPLPAMLGLSFLLSDFSWLCFSFFFLHFSFYIIVYPVTHPVIVSDGEQGDSVTYVHDMPWLWIQGLIASTSWSLSGSDKPPYTSLVAPKCYYWNLCPTFLWRLCCDSGNFFLNKSQ